MANTKGVANYRNPLCPGKPSFLPPRSPFPSISPAYADHVGPKGSHKPREGHNRHQRTSSESFIFEEQPSWLDDLLNEPETPVKKGAHRRSSSDSFAYLDASSISSKIEDVAREELRDRSFGRHRSLVMVKQCSIFPTRSRVRKLQYIAELERNCQALQAGGCEVSAELEFLDQQNIILNLENTALKQRLDSLAQEKYIKHLQQEMLEREIARLRALHQQQQLNQHHLQEQPIATHGRSRSRDLDAHFANLSLKHREGNPTRDPVTGPLRI
ncbi:unnamed protein product [Spirodela intermedia]|uniref:Uncharacterized protein n=1 Tax=Spirodela intermedia TaxID=51605 RepID=A0A7I8J140_SPIIN|nr:unnamed protein product [Spirodela intermedia]CAA6663944.1 unnamed protein product [Spirodela intermedia]